MDRDNLVRAVIRYPGGVPGRWQRIAESLGRSVPDVIRKAKYMSKELMSISQKSRYYMSTFLSRFQQVFTCNSNNSAIAFSFLIQ